MTQTLMVLVPLLLLAASFAFMIYQRRKQKFSPFNEPMLRPPGYSLGKALDALADRILAPLLCAAVIPTVLILGQGKLGDGARVVVWVLIIIIGLVCMRQLIFLLRSALPLRLGYEGELYTGSELNYLMRDGAWVFHDIPYQYGNIDHIVISTGGVFAVETKAIRKPAKEQGRAQYELTVDGDKMILPHAVTSQPLTQAMRHAGYLRKRIKHLTGISTPVTPVVAIPGWYINTAKSPSKVLVINPKRGGLLRKLVKREIIAAADVDQIAAQIEAIARSVHTKSDMTDPDAAAKYDYMNTRKPTDRRF